MTTSNLNLEYDFGGLENNNEIRFSTLYITALNPYGGNPKNVRDGGYEIATNQLAPSGIFPIGPKATHTPMNGRPFEVLSAPVLRIALLGYTPVHNVVAQASLVQPVGDERPLPTVSIGSDWINARTPSGASVTQTRMTWFVVFEGDKTGQVYRLDFRGGSTKAAESVANQINAITRAYSRLASEATGKTVAAPPTFAFWVELGVVDSPIPWGKAEKSSFITPPELKTPVPETIEEVVALRVSQEDYRRMKASYDLMRLYLDSQYAPHLPRQLDARFLAAAGISDRPAIGAAPFRSKIASASSTQAEVKIVNPDDLLTADQYEAKNGEGSFAEFVKKGGLTVDELVQSYEVNTFADIPATIGDIRQVLEVLALG